MGLDGRKEKFTHEKNFLLTFWHLAWLADGEQLSCVYFKWSGAVLIWMELAPPEAERIVASKQASLVFSHHMHICGVVFVLQQ